MIDLIKIILESDFTDPTGKYWGNSAAGVIFYCNKTNRFLLSHRSVYVNEPNTWGVIGGAIDEGESPVKAAIRELREEIGYNARPGDLKLIYIYKDKGFKYFNYLLIVNEEFQPKLDHETKETRWFKLSDFPNNLHFGVKKLLPYLKKINRKLK
jgi:8-oxo-dGTP pyrophosphatase MutT (NUDIX family)